MNDILTGIIIGSICGIVVPIVFKWLTSPHPKQTVKD